MSAKTTLSVPDDKPEPPKRPQGAFFKFAADVRREHKEK